MGYPLPTVVKRHLCHSTLCKTCACRCSFAYCLVAWWLSCVPLWWHTFAPSTQQRPCKCQASQHTRWSLLSLHRTCFQSCQMSQMHACQLVRTADVPGSASAQGQLVLQLCGFAASVIRSLPRPSAAMAPATLYLYDRHTSTSHSLRACV